VFARINSVLFIIAQQAVDEYMIASQCLFDEKRSRHQREKPHTAVCINSCARAEAAGATGACAALIAVHLAAHKLAFVIAELMNY
jgi:hypothetical protein